MNNITIRLERPDDYRQSEHMTREAFWGVYRPGCDEHYILHRMRDVPAFVQELDFVACDGGQVIGNIVYTRAKVVDVVSEHEVLSLGPVAVLPAYQGKGIGGMLIRHTLALAAQLGYKAAILFGHPAYYSRFGFVNAQQYGITTADGKNFDAFMALELHPDGLKGIHGRFVYDPVFEQSVEDVEEFDKLFPPREKHITDTQLK